MLIVALSFGFGKLGLFVVDGWMYWWVGGWLRKELLMEFIRKWWEIVSELTSMEHVPFGFQMQFCQM